jgi:hypothetical protein
MCLLTCFGLILYHEIHGQMECSIFFLSFLCCRLACLVDGIGSGQAHLSRSFRLVQSITRLVS